jgi:tRNA threonylcarbamoyladenosine biosynthesis protein TsaB
MSLLLAIESSSNEYRVVIGRDGAPVFDSTIDTCNSSLRTLDALLSCGLELLATPPTEIKGIAINVGPGSLTFVRAGISFVNALAFSLGVDIYPFNWFEIVANQTNELTTLPVIAAVPASNDNAYVGLIRGASVEIMRFGRVHEALAKVSAGLMEVAVAGRIRQRLAALLNGVRVVDTGVESPDARTLLKMAYEAANAGEHSTTQVQALNDQSALFYATDYMDDKSDFSV